VVERIASIALSFYYARKAPPIARVVPTYLLDRSVSQAPGTKLSYFGYEFEVPWTDLDDTETRLYPKDKPDKVRADLRFRSGLRLLVTAIPPKSWAAELAVDLKVPPQRVELTFGESDYSFCKTVYEFTPEKMNHWSLSERVHARDFFLLLIKSMVLPGPAETGIFNLENQNYRGFQIGNPQVRHDGVVVHLFSDEGSVEMIFSQKDYRGASAITQPEINRVVQSLHRVPKSGVADSQMAKG
jgi:hypothetical protein